jgi:ATP synthase protein I
MVQTLVGVMVALLSWLITGRPPQAGRQRMERWRSCCPRRCLQEAWFVSGREVPGRPWRDFRLGTGEAGAVHCHVGGCAKLVPDLSWLALLAGLIVVMKTYWVALLVRSSVQNRLIFERELTDGRRSARTNCK